MSSFFFPRYRKICACKNSSRQTIIVIHLGWQCGMFWQWNTYSWLTDPSAHSCNDPSLWPPNQRYYSTRTHVFFFRKSFDGEFGWQAALRRFITCQCAAFSLSTSDKFLLLKTLMNYSLSTIFLSVSTEYNFLLFIRKYFQIDLSLTFGFKPTSIRLLQRAFRRCSI